MKTLNTLSLAALSSIVTMVFAGSATAAIIQTKANNNGHTFFDSSAVGNDLINTASTTLSNFVGPSNKVHDGSNGNIEGTWYTSSSTVPVTFTYTLNTTLSATGYDIMSINSIYGWHNNNGHYTPQNYDVLVATIDNPTLTLLTEVDYIPTDYNSSASSSMVTITDSVGPLATGVTQIRFTLYSPNQNTNNSYSSDQIGLVREIDVVGSATAVPEPTTTALLGLGGLALILRRRR